jgi:predicted AlkP superfamily pyrophosphatase or phosphodiesterase
LKNGPFRNVFTNALELLPRIFETNWRVRNRISILLKKHLGWTGYFQLYSLPISKLKKLDVEEKKDIFKPGGLSNVKSISDIFVGRKIPHHISDYRKCEIDNINDLQKEIEKGKIEFAFLYTADLDGLLHKESKDGENISKKLRWYESQVVRLIKTCEKFYDKVEFMIISDHGMTTYIESLNINKSLNLLEIKEGVDYEVLLDSTMARFIFYNEKAKDEIFKALGTEKGRFLTSVELAEWGCNFTDNSYGDSIFLVDPGIQIVPCDMGKKALLGMHGYSPMDKDSYACFLSNERPRKKPSWVGDFFELMVG